MNSDIFAEPKVSLDMLVHPWWSRYFANAPYMQYGKGLTIYKELSATLEEYASFLGNLLEQRFREISNDQYHFLGIIWAGSFLKQEEEELYTAARGYLRDKVVTATVNDNLSGFRTQMVHTIQRRLPASLWREFQPAQVSVYALR